MEEVPGSEKFFPAQRVFLALGFLGPEAEVLKSLGIKQDARSNIQTPANVCTFLCSMFEIDSSSHCTDRNTRRALRACLPLVTAVVASRSSSGVFRKAVVVRPRWMLGLARDRLAFPLTVPSRRGYVITSLPDAISLD